MRGRWGVCGCVGEFLHAHRVSRVCFVREVGRTRRVGWPSGGGCVGHLSRCLTGCCDLRPKSAAVGQLPAGRRVEANPRARRTDLFVVRSVRQSAALKSNRQRRVEQRHASRPADVSHGCTVQTTRNRGANEPRNLTPSTATLNLARTSSQLGIHLERNGSAFPKSHSLRRHGTWESLFIIFRRCRRRCATEKLLLLMVGQVNSCSNCYRSRFSACQRLSNAPRARFRASAATALCVRSASFEPVSWAPAESAKKVQQLKTAQSR